jgi:Flp pilus assembly protein TadG
MKREIASFAHRLARDEGGAVIALVAIMMVAMIGLAALAVDVGNLVYAQMRLQAVADFAAQAGAEVISCGSCTATSPITAAESYSGATNANTTPVYNTQSGLSISLVSGYPKALCVSAVTSPCGGPSNANIVVVKEQTQVSFTLGQIFGFGTVTLTATSYAAQGGGLPPMNIMVVLDNTGSMNNTDPTGASCGGITNATRAECALAGIQTMLTELWPTQDQVGLIVFPPVSTSPASATYDAECNGPTITVEPYSAWPSTATYTILTPQWNYKANNQATSLEDPTQGGGPGTSALVNATCHAGIDFTVNGVTSNCGPAGTSKKGQPLGCSGDQVIGNQGTYLADAIYIATQDLLAPPAAGSPCSTLKCRNVMIVLSDGGAGNASKQAAITASQLTPIGGQTVYLSSATPASVIVGSSVADTTTKNPTTLSNDTLAIPAGTQVASTFTALSSTVPLTEAVAASFSAVPSLAASANATSLTFLCSAFTALPVKGMNVTDTAGAIPAPASPPYTSAYTITNVTACGSGKTATITITLSAGVKANIASGGSCIFGPGDCILFGGVLPGDTISFGATGQCNAAITQAQTAAGDGIWVYSIAYGSSTAAAPNANSCSDTEPNNISSCYTMAHIANSPGNTPDPTKFYSDPMGGNCTSTANPNITSLAEIFENLGFMFTATLPNGLSLAGN